MSTELIISIVGAVVAVLVSVIGAFLANRNSIILQTRKLKEAHYMDYITALQNYTTSEGKIKAATLKYIESRNTIFAIASEEVARCIIKFEENSFGSRDPKVFNGYLTDLFKAIRRDLHLKNRNLPTINFLKAN